jgi:hypothetical protein
MSVVLEPNCWVTIWVGVEPLLMAVPVIELMALPLILHTAYYG